MDHNFDPYNFIMELNERLSRLEYAHNKMAHAFQQSERELTETLKILKNLQIKHNHLHNVVFEEFRKNNIQPPDLNNDKINNSVRPHR
jgi:hypothetical protein